MSDDGDSDSSAGRDIQTGVTLGYATQESTEDTFSQLGGEPTWLTVSEPPDGTLAKCLVCKGLLNLLLQLNTDLPDQFPGHERACYIFACRKKACRRKNGSIRGLRYTNVYDRNAQPTQTKTVVSSKADTTAPSATNLGGMLFGATSNGTQALSANPFGTSKTSSGANNPFGASASTATPVLTTNALSQTFAEKVRIASNDDTPAAVKQESTATPWPETSAFPAPFPSFHIDADKEYLDPEPPAKSEAAQVDVDAGGPSSSAMDAQDAFESSMDKSFQRFADRISQNPEQVLRYEYNGQPLLYSKTDSIGKSWPKVTRCSRCGSTRVFELQLTPYTITELEADDMSLEGMDWGTIILATCSKDCEGWGEEWVGVQWEEVASKRAT